MNRIPRILLYTTVLSLLAAPTHAHHAEATEMIRRMVPSMIAKKLSPLESKITSTRSVADKAAQSAGTAMTRAIEGVRNAGAAMSKIKETRSQVERMQQQVTTIDGRVAALESDQINPKVRHAIQVYGNSSQLLCSMESRTTLAVPRKRELISCDGSTGAIHGEVRSIHTRYSPDSARMTITTLITIRQLKQPQARN